MNEQELKNNFTYHAPSKEKVYIHETIRNECYDLAQTLNDSPDSREKSLSITKLEECMMWANACVARND